jgi:6-phosphogluconolactonase (cycloisomerase 2 family)
VYTQVPNSPFTAGGGTKSIAFNPSGSLLAAANYSANTVQVFSVATSGALTQTASVSPGTAPRAVAFSPDGTLLAEANYTSNTLKLYSVSTGRSRASTQAAARTRWPSAPTVNTSHSPPTAPTRYRCGKWRRVAAA